jgi:hypothetical protein
MLDAASRELCQDAAKLIKRTELAATRSHTSTNFSVTRGTIGKLKA